MQGAQASPQVRVQALWAHLVWQSFRHRQVDSPAVGIIQFDLQQCLDTGVSQKPHQHFVWLIFFHLFLDLITFDWFK